MPSAGAKRASSSASAFLHDKQQHACCHAGTAPDGMLDSLLMTSTSDGGTSDSDQSSIPPTQSSAFGAAAQPQASLHEMTQQLEFGI